jgi:hypothetical protein
MHTRTQAVVDWKQQGTRSKSSLTAPPTFGSIHDPVAEPPTKLAPIGTLARASSLPVGKKPLGEWFGDSMRVCMPVCVMGGFVVIVQFPYCGGEDVRQRAHIAVVKIPGSEHALICVCTHACFYQGRSTIPTPSSSVAGLRRRESSW